MNDDDVAARVKRAQAYDRLERACDHGIGHPGGPTGWRPQRKGVTGGAAAMLRRLRKRRPDLHKRVMAGELTVCAAAIAAGFRKGSHRQSKPVIVSQIPMGGDIANAITPLQEMALWLGLPDKGGPVFSDDNERRRLWVAHRDRLMRLFGQDGSRPMAFWQYDSPVPFPGLDRQRSTLYEHGLLSAAERRTLVADWHAEFKRASQPNFFFIGAPGEIYHGALARERHFIWADIPSALVQQWEAARQKSQLPQRAKPPPREL
jgi:hypothetical protein